MKKILMVVASLVVALGISGCAPQYTPPDYSGYVWPPPPQKTRIKLLHIIASDVDVRGASTAESLFGAQAKISFLKPYGVAVDGQENIYVTDTYLRKVFVINLGKKSIGELFNPKGWKAPTDVAVDDTNGLIAVSNDAAVDLFDLGSQKFIRSIGTKKFQRASGVAFDPDRKVLYITDTKSHAIYAYNHNGELIAPIADRVSTKETVYFPTGLEVDDEGRIYVVDTMNFRVVIFNPDGSLYRMFGEHGDQPGQLARPKGVGVSRDGLVFVTDASFSNFQVFDDEGNVYLFVGGVGRGPGGFQTPAGVAIDKNDKLYVVDQSNRRVQIFQIYSDSYYEEHPEEAAKFKNAPKRKEPLAAQEDPSSEAVRVDTDAEPEMSPSGEGIVEEEIPSPEELEDIGW